MLTVLGYEGPLLRAYLLFLKHHGIAVDRLVMLAPCVDVATGKSVAPLLPKPWRAKFGLKLHGMRMNHWPNMIALRQPDLFTTISKTMQKVYDLPPDFYAHMLRSFNWRDFAKQVDIVATNGLLKDPQLRAWMANNIRGAVLYTGGGIVPESLLALEGMRFIHIHPGYLPHVRGADGLLWSILLRGKFGISGFYMAKGIDTGDLLFATEQDMVTFDTPIDPAIDGQLLYRAVFAFIDPVMRAQHLCDLLKSHTDFMSMPSIRQSATEGETFHFMHPRLRDHALSKLFPAWSEWRARQESNLRPTA